MNSTISVVNFILHVYTQDAESYFFGTPTPGLENLGLDPGPTNLDPDSRLQVQNRTPTPTPEMWDILIVY